MNRLCSSEFSGGQPINKSDSIPHIQIDGFDESNSQFITDFLESNHSATAFYNLGLRKISYDSRYAYSGDGSVPLLLDYPAIPSKETGYPVSAQALIENGEIKIFNPCAFTDTEDDFVNDQFVAKQLTHELGHFIFSGLKETDSDGDVTYSFDKILKTDFGRFFLNRNHPIINEDSKEFIESCMLNGLTTPYIVQCYSEVVKRLNIVINNQSVNAQEYQQNYNDYVYYYCHFLDEMFADMYSEIKFNGIKPILQLDSQGRKVFTPAVVLYNLVLSLENQIIKDNT